ncbi:hypothetical protein [Streptomyces sp. NBS 14/10]|uniref:hypothetical protein n=1 Tax=Streptomyces sp. NBS 14/10 TaxID=1945643 RepID=UPI00351D41FB
MAGADALRPADLRESVLWRPAELNRLDFLRRFADEFRITRRHDGPNLGQDHLLQHLRTDPEGFTEAGRTRRWLEDQPQRDWLPDTDRPKLVAR